MVSVGENMAIYLHIKHVKTIIKKIYEYSSYESFNNICFYFLKRFRFIFHLQIVCVKH